MRNRWAIALLLLATATVSSAGLIVQSGPKLFGETSGGGGEDGVTLVDGVLTINKSAGGFGTKTNAAPFFWQDFADPGQNGVSNCDLNLGYADQRVHDASTPGSGGSNAVTCDSDGGRSTSQGAITLTMTWAGSGDRDFFPKIVVENSNTAVGGSLRDQSTDTLYFSYWMKAVRVSGTNTADMQIKGPRAGTRVGAIGTDYYSTGRPNYLPSIYIEGDATYSSLFQFTVASDGSFDDFEHFLSTPPGTWNVGGWNFIEVWMSYNTPGVANGVMRFWINGTSMLPFSNTANSTTIRVRESGDENEHFDFVFLTPGVDMQGMGSATTYTLSFSEHSIDTEAKRVIITNSSSDWDAPSSSNWAVQPTTSWSDTAIAAEYNKSGFTPGQTGYVWVCTTITACTYEGSVEIE